MRAATGRGRKAVPARLLLLMGLAVTLGALSLIRLRAAWPHTPARQQQELGLSLPHLGDAAAQPEDHPQQPHQPGQEAGSCFARYPWIRGALDSFYEPAWAAANASTQTTEESLEALRRIMWPKQYHPGMDEVALQLNPDSGQVEMTVAQISPPNQPHKQRCALEVLAGAVQRHSAELAALLEPPGRQLRFILQTEDFGVTWRKVKSKLPAFSFCTDDAHSDIPVPDHTFACYPEARYTNSSWPAIQKLLQAKSDMVAWGERHPELFHRSNWAVGPRRGLMPLLQTYANGSAGINATSAFGVELDIENTGFVRVQQGKAAGKRDSFVWLDGQCDHKYLIHTAGFSYSAGLKYKLACGSLVFKFASTYREFFEPALQDGVHVVRLPATHEGVDPQQFRAFTAPRIKEVVLRTLGMAELPPIARGGQQFVREQLTPEALHCYWLGALQRYAKLYFMPKTPAQVAHEAGGGAGANSGANSGASSGSAFGAATAVAAGGGGVGTGGAADNSGVDTRLP